MAITRARGEFPVYWPDKVRMLQTDPNIKQLIFVMHGIRDESTWPAEIKRAIERLIGDQAATVKVIPPLYRRFTMLPFLLLGSPAKCTLVHGSIHTSKGYISES